MTFVTFKDAVEATPHLAGAWKEQLDALRRRDKRHVEVPSPQNLRGSVNLDTCLRHAFPNDSRWDYGVAYRRGNGRRESIYWIEVHSANTAEISVVLRKLEWLKRWLSGDGKSLNGFEREFVWIASRRTSFSRNAPQLRQLAQSGMRFSGRNLRLGVSPLSR